MPKFSLSKKFISLVSLTLSLLLGLSACSSFTKTNNKAAFENRIFVYNWGSYLAPELLTKFEQETKIKVVYETFNTNEDLYVKLTNSSNKYDVIVPSDYMIERLIKEDLLKPLTTTYCLTPNTSILNLPKLLTIRVTNILCLFSGELWVFCTIPI